MYIILQMFLYIILIVLSLGILLLSRQLLDEYITESNN